MANALQDIIPTHPDNNSSRRTMYSSNVLFRAMAALLATASLADASAIINVTESGGAVFISGEGSLNIEGLSLLETSTSGQGINSSSSFLELSSGATDLYQSISGPANFGSGSFTFPSSGSGDRFGVRYGAASLSVPAGYVSGSPLSGTSVFASTTFASLGLTPGSYTWTWGSGGNADSLTINIGVEPPPPTEVTPFAIDENRNPVLQWQAETGRRYSVWYSTDLKKYTPIAEGFPFGGATDPVLEFTDLPIFTNTTPRAFYRIETNPVDTPDSTTDLEAFFVANGGKAGFADVQVKALETLLYGLDEIDAGQLDEARARIDAMLAQYPLSTSGWNNGYGYLGLNFGNPAGYYGIRMLDQILALGNPTRAGTLRMTAVVAPSAVVTRPTLPNFDPETVNLDIAPEILADDAKRLHMVTRLFRHWVQAITGGLHVELEVYVMDQGATVNFTEQPGWFNTYPDYQAMIQSVPASIANTTDFWWIIAPSGVPGDGTGYGKDFISGGMTGDGTGRPVFLSDDAWFTRKPVHLGSGPYSEIELRMYQPMWFQHEFMHHVFGTWPQFGLEAQSHQWFDRGTWPEDFVGVNESDYYIEAINKRILGATPSLAEALQAPDYADMASFPVAKLPGSYQRNPVENAFHQVTITLDGGNNLQWNNAAPLTWGMEVIGSELWWSASSPYGAQKLKVEIDANGDVTAIRINGERYVRTTTL